MRPRFVLASQSPARQRLLQQAGIEPDCLPSHFDEDAVQSRNPANLVETLALGKAEVIAQRLGQVRQPTIVLGCDSVLAINGEIHGKPDSPTDAIQRWQYMRGRVGELYTGHAVIYLGVGEPQRLVRCGMTQVHFGKPTDHQIAAYVASGEPLNCAGCFALEGKGSLFVERLEGCHTNVIGLSMPLLRQMLGEMGIDVTDFWQ
jgi:septum formation protein